MIPVFDIGNVLVRWAPDALALALTGEPARARRFRETACDAEFFLACDRAARFSDVVALWSGRFPEFAEELRAFDARWMEAVPGAIGPHVELLRELKAQGPVHAVTNYPADKFEASRVRFPFYDLFDVAVVSGREGLAKPDPAIFRLLFERAGRAPQELLFMDDSPANVAAARALGMAAIHVTDATDLRAELRREGFAV